MGTKTNAKVAKLQGIADSTIGALLKPEVEDFDKVIDALTMIPVRDYTMRFAYDNPELRPTIAESLFKLSTQKDDEVLHTVMAGIFLLDDNRDLAKVEVERALDLNNQYSLARLLDVALTNNIPSRVWAQSLSDVTPEQCLTGAVQPSKPKAQPIGWAFCLCWAVWLLVST